MNIAILGAGHGRAAAAAHFKRQIVPTLQEKLVVARV